MHLLSDQRKKRVMQLEAVGEALAEELSRFTVGDGRAVRSNDAIAAWEALVLARDED